MTQQRSYDTPAPPTSRGDAFRALLALMGAGLPDLVGIRFRDPDGDCHHHIAQLNFADGADLAAWAAELDLVIERPRMSGNTMVHSAFGHWHGWRIVAAAFPALRTPTDAELLAAVSL